MIDSTVIDSTQLLFGLRMYNFTFHEQYQLWIIDQSELAKILWVRIIARLETFVVITTIKIKIFPDNKIVTSGYRFLLIIIWSNLLSSALAYWIFCSCKLRSIVICQFDLNRRWFRGKICRSAKGFCLQQTLPKFNLESIPSDAQKIQKVPSHEDRDFNWKLF